MNARSKFRPNLDACELEDRLVTAIANLGVIVLTTGGYVLVTPFAGVAAYPGGSPGGAPIPTSFVMTGSGGISSIQPGNSTGGPGVATTAPTGSIGGASVTISVGSGANDAGALNIPVVTRNTIANDALVPPPRIGGVFGDRSPVLPPGQADREGFPVTAPGVARTDAPAERAGRIPVPGHAGASSLGPGDARVARGSDASPPAVNAVAARVP